MPAVAWDLSWGHGPGPYMWPLHIIVWTCAAWCLDSKGEHPKHSQVETITFSNTASKSRNFTSATHKSAWIQGEGTRDLSSWWGVSKRSMGDGRYCSVLTGKPIPQAPSKSIPTYIPQDFADINFKILLSCMRAYIYTFRCVSCLLLGLTLEISSYKPLVNKDSQGRGMRRSRFSLQSNCLCLGHYMEFRKGRNSLIR